MSPSLFMSFGVVSAKSNKYHKPQDFPAVVWQSRGREKEVEGKEMNIYVGNLNYSSTEDSLRTLFEAHGEVASASIIKFRDTGRSRGFGFVEMPNKSEAEAAIVAVSGTNLDGNSLTVNEARPKTERRERSYHKQDRW